MPKDRFSEDSSELVDAKKLFDQALRLLARREHAEVELSQKLELRGWRIQMIEAVIQELRKIGYLSNDRYIEMRTRHLIKQNYGFTRIQQDLGRFDLSVSKAFYDREIEELGIDLDQQLDDLIHKSLKGGDPSSEDFFKLRVRVTDRLVRRGFSPESVKSRMNYWVAEYLSS